MNDPFRKVSPGDPLPNSARSHNHLLASAQMFRRTMLGGPANAPADVPLDYGISMASVVLIQAQGGGSGGGYPDLDPYTVLTYGPAVITPSADRPYLSRRATFIGMPPGTPDDVVCITLDPIPAGGIGRAVCSGRAVVQVDFTDPTHTRAVPIPGETGFMASASFGGIPILYSEDTSSGGSGTGLRWCVVLVGDPGGASGGSGGGLTITVVTNVCPVYGGSGSSGSGASGGSG